MTSIERYQQVAALHAAGIHQGFLATLGIPFLALMYRAIDEAPESVLLVEEYNERVIGFASGGIGMGAIYRRMLRHPFRLGAALLPSVVRPTRLLRIIEILRYSRSTGNEQSLPAAELLSIVVDPTWRGKDVANKLYNQLVEAFRERGVEEFRITVGASLAAAHRFYQRMGAVVVGQTQVHHGEPSSVYVYRIT